MHKKYWIFLAVSTSKYMCIKLCRDVYFSYKNEKKKQNKTKTRQKFKWIEKLSLLPLLAISTSPHVKLISNLPSLVTLTGH